MAVFYWSLNVDIAAEKSEVSSVYSSYTGLLVPFKWPWDFIYCLNKSIFCSLAHYPSLYQKTIYFFKLYTFFSFFKGTPVAYGISQTRSWIRATDAVLCHSHSNARSEPYLQATVQLAAMPDPNPVSEVRNWTHILMNTS